MRIEEVNLSRKERRLFNRLASLRAKLDRYTLGKWQRINPFFENLSDWNQYAKEYNTSHLTVFNSSTIIGPVKLGEHVWIGAFCTIDGSGGLSIGDHCVLANGVQIFTHDTIRWALTGGKVPHEHGPVEIGECTFVGAQAVILKNVTIGHHCVVAANATVTQSIPPYSLCAGSPARVIGKVVIEGDAVTYEYHSRP